jgi:hypothetical protein
VTQLMLASGALAVAVFSLVAAFVLVGARY